MSGSKRQRSAKRAKASTLKQHRQQGKTLKPPLRTLEKLRSIPWLRETFPDMLWLCAVVVTATNAKDGMLLATRFLDELDNVWKEGSVAMIDGRLTAFDRIPEELRLPFIERSIDAGLYQSAITEDFANLLLLYPNAPGLWLVEPWRKRIPNPNHEQADAFLGRVLPPVWHGQSELATHVKFLILRARFKAGNIHVPPGGAFELFPMYPDQLTEEQLRVVRPTIRATFIGLAAEDPTGLEWARYFWRYNWRLYPCGFAEWQKEKTEGKNELDSVRAKLLAARSDLAGHMAGIERRFEEVAHDSDPDLYAPDRYEVLTGVVGRIVRLVSLLVHNPSLWQAEYGMTILRSAVESLIVFRWIIKKEREDGTIFGQFKDYGRGHLKLLKLHVDEQVASMEKPPAGLLEYQKELEEEVNADLLEEFQDIHLDATFSKENVRDMAKDVGMTDDYRFYYAPASSIAHGEWYGLDRYVLDRCTNPAHGVHRTYRAGDRFALTPYLGAVAAKWAEDLVREYSHAIASAHPEVTQPG
jgi:hypothetical protein